MHTRYGLDGLDAVACSLYVACSPSESMILGQVVMLDVVHLG